MSVASVFNPVTFLNHRRKDLDGRKWSYQLGQAGQYGLDTTISNEPDIDESRMAVVIPFASGQRRDQVGDLLEVEGIDTSRHAKNPIVLMDHGKAIAEPIAITQDPESGIYTVEIDPIAKVARAKAFFYQGKSLLTGVKKDQQYPHALFCEQVFDLIAKRYIRGGSIGYQVIHAKHLGPDYSTGIPQGLHLQAILMLECSAVILPANGDTVRKCLSMPRICGKSPSPWLIKSLSPYLPEDNKITVGFADIKSLRMKYHQNKVEKKSQLSEGIPSDTACEIIREGTVHGKPLTESQRSMFGAACGKEKSIKDIRLKYRKCVGTGSSRGGQRELGTIPNKEDNPVKEQDTGPLKLQGLLDESIKAIRLKYKKKANQPKYSLWFLGPGKQVGVRQDYESEQEMIQDASQAARDGWEVSKTPFEPGGLNVGEPPRKAPERGKPRKLSPQEQPTTPYRGRPCSEGPRGITAEATGCIPGKNLQVKSLLDIRQKYRTSAKRFRRRLRKSIPGRSMVYIRSKDVEKAKEMAKQKGLVFEHLGTKGNAEKIRLIGDDKAIDEVAKTFGKLLASAH